MSSPPNFDIGCMQSPIPHAPDYYMEKSHEDDPKMWFQIQYLMNIVRP